MARSGTSAEVARRQVMEVAPNGYLAVVEGAIPVGDDGVYCTVGGRAFSDVVREVCGGSAATIAVGSCAFDGGAPAAGGGLTGSVGVEQVVPDVSLVNLPGCPVNVENLAATIVHYLTFKTLPATDARHRPLFAYGGLLHNQCERRAHFEFGEFVQAWGDEGSQKGWCLYKMGCKGPETFANCPTARYAGGISWPVKAGHGCIGCTTAGFWDQMSPVYGRLPGPLPFAPQVSADQLGIALVGGVAALTVAHGTASAIRLRRWGAEERRAVRQAEVGVDEGDTSAAGATEAIDAVDDGDVDAAGATAGDEEAAEAAASDEASGSPTTATPPAPLTETVDGAADPEGGAR
jgi:hydrogenase small subunit